MTNSGKQHPETISMNLWKPTQRFSWLQRPWVLALLAFLFVLPMGLGFDTQEVEAKPRTKSSKRAKSSRAKASKRSGKRSSKRSSKRSGKRKASKKGALSRRGKVTKKRRVKKGRRRVVRKRRVVRRRPSRTYRRTRYYGHYRPHRSTVVHHHHYDDRGDVVVRGEREEPTVRSRKRDRTSVYFGLGLGVVGLDNQLSNQTGSGLGLSLGSRSGNLSLELGFLAASQEVEGRDDRGNLVQDLAFGGVSADARIFLPLNKTIEPYGTVGLGYYALDSTEGGENFAPALNLGAGIDVRLTREFAIGGRYTYHGFWFDDVATSMGNVDSTWAGLFTGTVYF